MSLPPVQRKRGPKCLHRQADPGVIYVERSSNCTEDDESPLSFIADTVSNIAGHRAPWRQVAGLESGSIEAI